MCVLYVLYAAPCTLHLVLRGSAGVPGSGRIHLLLGREQFVAQQRAQGLD